MRSLVDAVAHQLERDDGLRPGLYAADLLCRFLVSIDPGDPSGEWSHVPCGQPPMPENARLSLASGGAPG